MKKSYYFLGIGGIGMSSLAHVLLDQGHRVAGEDLNENANTQSLKKRGAIINSKLSEEAVVVYSSAISSHHPTRKEAQSKGLCLLHRSELLKEVMQSQKSLLVAGTHGKTSTSALLAHVLISSGFDPSFSIGGVVPSLRGNGHYGRGEYFVAEADESDGSFLNYPGKGAIITNIESEHLDYWKSEDKLIEGFISFTQNIAEPALLFWCIDDPILKKLALPGVSYGEAKEAALRLEAFRQNENGIVFTAAFKGQRFVDIQVPVLGKHQALNALAVFGLALQLGLKEHEVREGFLTFKGVGRRLEKKGEAKGVTIYDDYAHHPTEIHSMLSALKSSIGSRRLLAVFQPHRYSRTADLLDAFANSFGAADLCIVTDIYSAGENPIEGISGEALLNKVKVPQAHTYISQVDLVEKVSALLNPGDVVVTVGAGDITHLGTKLLEVLQ